MVNTRRMELNGSAQNPRHRTRGSLQLVKGTTEEADERNSTSSSSSSVSDSEDHNPKTIADKFAFTDRKYPLARPRRSISLKQRTIVFSRKMREEPDAYERDNDSDEVYSIRGRRSKHRLRMNTMQRRTALSLRPISQKSYADPHSPLMNSDCEEVEIRRSKRKKQNFSWLADSQMHKVGYPNLNAVYTEDSSRDAADNHEIDKRVTRRNSDRGAGRETNPPAYLFDYESELPPRRSRSVKNIEEVKITVKEEANDKENRRVLNKTNKIKEESKNGEDNVEESKDNDNKEQKTNSNKEDEDDTSDSEKEIPLARLRLKNSVYPPRRQKPKYSRKLRNNADTDSSSSEEEERRRYPLRDRRPRQAPKNMQTSVLKTNRRHLKKIRSLSSSSDSSSSDRVSKPPKNQHSKNEKLKSVAAGSTNFTPIQPETLDSSIRFNSIGGLDGHVQCLKEMILLPMMYPEVFKQFNIKPPKGVLFHGPPGTGKTLLARALANECSFGKRKVSFFQRKGADLLSKWVGESEKQLRMLFEQAAEMSPSIIFFDELDGLASARSTRQDQYHTSIVSTFLALMDGLEDRGQIIIIGATNRIDNLDPAFRRPGRFDRELFFPLPTRNEREEIIDVHTSSWENPPKKSVLSYLAEHTIGYCGSDLRALCSEAVIQSFRRTYPQVYNSEHKLLLNANNVRVETVDFMRAKSLLVPASQRISQALGRKLYPTLKPILQSQLENALGIIKQTFPHGLNPSLAKVKLSPNMRPAQLLITADGSGHGQNHLAPALLFAMEHVHSYLLDLNVLYQETARGQEETCIKTLDEVCKNVPSILFIPNIDEWWDMTSEVVKCVLKSWLEKLNSNIPILFLATAKNVYEQLCDDLKQIFSMGRNEIMHLSLPNAESRRLFFKPLLIDACLKPPVKPRERVKTPPPLPKAPTPPPTPMTEQQKKKLYDQEEHTLRELRIFLRDICKKLANNKLFYMFTKPVDTEEVPDYTTIIKQPMDLETMMTKVDFHRYESAKDFLADIELICQNALEYNPARTSADKQIRHRACSLRDYAYTLIKTEMDTDFEDKCQTISKKRKERKCCSQQYLPTYIRNESTFHYVEQQKPTDENKNDDPSETNANSNEVNSKSVSSESSKNGTENIVNLNKPNDEQKITPRKRKQRWQKGFLMKKRRKTQSQSPIKEEISEDDSKENEADGTKEDIEQDLEENSIKDTNVPLTINCDEQSSKTEDKINSNLLSPRRRLSNLLSPSELLDYHLDFDDIEEALNDSVLNSSTSCVPAVDIQTEDLEKVLNETVDATDGFSLELLLDLYNNLSRIIKQYSMTHLRNTLPKELAKEMVRFLKTVNTVNDDLT